MHASVSAPSATAPAVEQARRALRARWLAVRDAALVVVAAGLVFQVLHVAEHLIQVVAWLGAPTSPAFLTPWAVEGRDLLATVAGTGAGTGNELLHLVGNVIFLAALVGLAAFDTADDRTGIRARSTARRRATRLAIGWQSVHVAEHVLLTTSAVVTGTAWGASTLFGLVATATPTAIAIRVLAHFLLNAIPTVLTVRALAARSPVASAPAAR